MILLHHTFKANVIPLQVEYDTLESISEQKKPSALPNIFSRYEQLYL